MANVLTPELIHAQRELAEGDIRKAEQAIVVARHRLADCDAADRILALVGGESPEESTVTNVAKSSPSFFGGGYPFSSKNPFKPNTNKAFIWESLNDGPGIWFNANEIQDQASRLKGDDIPMSSISPSLSEMKDDHLERRGMLVALKSRLNENGAAETAPDAEEDGASSMHTQSVEDLSGEPSLQRQPT